MKRVVVMVVVVSLFLIAVVMAAGCGSSSGTQTQVTSPSGQVISKQKVEDFVKEAIAYGKKYGQQKACAEFNNPKGKFVRGELYIYAYNWQGVSLANGGNPSLTGQNLIDMTDPNGVKVIQSLIKVAKSGGGWVSYTWPYPKTQINEPKLGYANKVNDQWWLGSGMYLEYPAQK